MAFTQLSHVPRPTATIYMYEPEGAGTVDHLNTHQFATAADVRAAVAVLRHTQAAQFLYVDGHAGALAWSTLSTSFSPQTSPFDPQTAQ